MPHNWASAECVLYLRHIMALEDGDSLRLLEGIGDFELNGREPFAIEQSPTRFGRISMMLEPINFISGWRLNFERRNGPVPEKLTLPYHLGGKGALQKIDGAEYNIEGDVAVVEPSVESFTAEWK
jgi:hypothetical protein